MASSGGGGEPAGVEEVWKRLQSRPGVLGVLVVADGIAIRSTFDGAASVTYAALASHLVTKSRAALRRLGGGGGGAGVGGVGLGGAGGGGGAGDDELRTLRCRSRKNEVIICPHVERGTDMCLVVVQAPGVADAAA